jgi:hypothetical protein
LDIAAVVLALLGIVPGVIAPVVKEDPIGAWAQPDTADTIRAPAIVAT